MALAAFALPLCAQSPPAKEPRIRLYVKPPNPQPITGQSSPANTGQLIPANTGQFIPAKHDPFIPNFGRLADRVAAGKDEITGTVDCKVLFIGPGKSLTVKARATLKCETIQVAGGRFATEPGATIVFKDAPIDQTTDPVAYGHGLIAIDADIDIRGTPKTSFVRLAAEPQAGDPTLRLESAVTGWLVGDQLLLPDSLEYMREYGIPYSWQGETAAIASISADSKTITLASPLQFAHPGAYDGDGKLRFLAHVANLTRDTVVKSESATGTRGHLLFTGNSRVNIDSAEIVGLGRTKVGPTDSTECDVRGKAAKVGTNQIGRYPVHFHHVTAPPTINGCAIYCPMPNSPFRWGISVHDTNNGTITNNVVYNCSGWGIGTEDGKESNNLFEHNFVCRIGGTGAREDANGGFGQGNEGAGFWFAGADNRVRNDVACNCTTYCFSIVSRDAKVPIREWSGNEGYANLSGISIWNVGAGPTNVLNIPTSTIKDQKFWHISDASQVSYFIAHFVYDGWVDIGSRERLQNSVPLPSGIGFGDYLAADVTIVNADIQNLRYGIIVPPKAGDATDTTGASSPGTFTIKNCHLRNAINIYSGIMQASAGSLPPRKTIIDQVKFERPSVPVNGRSYDIYLEALLPPNQSNNANYVQLDQYLVTAFNAVAGDDFRVYFNEQKADFIVPQTGGNYIGCPAAGLTNEQAWSRFGACLGGEIAPATAQARERIFGLVR